MEAELKKDIYNQYIIFDQMQSPKTVYQEKMLCNNRLKYMLPFDLRGMDNAHKYYYDITAKVAIGNLMTGEARNRLEISTVFKDLINAMEELEEFLLESDGIVFDMAYTYFDFSLQQTFFVYIPGYDQDIYQQMKNTVAQMMNIIDYTKEADISFIYGLHKALSREGCTLPVIKRFLEAYGSEGDQEAAVQVKERHTILVNEDISERHSEKTLRKEKKDVSGEVLEWLCQGGILVGIMGMLLLYMYRYHLNTDVIKYGVLAVVAGELFFCGLYIFGVKKKGSKTNKINDAVCEKRQPDRKKEEKEGNPPLCIKNEKSSDHTTVLGTQVLKINELEDEKDGFQNIEVTFESVESDEIIKMTLNPFIIGKMKKQVDYCIEDPTVSRVHAKIEYYEGDVWVTDMGSSNGTFINSVRIKQGNPVKIQTGTMLRFSSREYLCKVCV